MLGVFENEWRADNVVLVVERKKSCFSYLKASLVFQTLYSRESDAKIGEA